MKVYVITSECSESSAVYIERVFLDEGAAKDFIKAFPPHEIQEFDSDQPLPANYVPGLTLFRVEELATGHVTCVPDYGSFPTGPSLIAGTRSVNWRGDVIETAPYWRMDLHAKDRNEAIEKARAEFAKAKAER